MDLLARGRYLVLILLASCGASGNGPPVGVSSYKGNKPYASSSAPHAIGVSPIPSDFRSKYTKMSARFHSPNHFIGRYDAILWASADAKEPYQNHASFPDGARLVIEHFEKGSERVGPLLMMERANGSWKYVMVTSEGTPLESPACAGCHAEAPKDSVFAVP